MDVNFYWEIITYDGEVFTVTMNQATAVKEAIARKSKHIEIKGETIAVSDIRRVRPTSKAVSNDEERNLLSTGDELDKSEVLVNPATSDAVWSWAKKYITRKDFETTYAKSPGYKKLGEEGNMLIVGFRKLRTTNEALNDGVYWCDEQEAAKLEKWRAEL